MRSLRAQESTGEPKRAKESPGEPRRAQDSPGEPRSAQERAGAQGTGEHAAAPQDRAAQKHAERAGQCASANGGLRKSSRRVGESKLFKNDGHGAQARATGAQKRATARRRDASRLSRIMKKQTARRREQFFGTFMAQKEFQTLFFYSRMRNQSFYIKPASSKKRDFHEKQPTTTTNHAQE